MFQDGGSMRQVSGKLKTSRSTQKALAKLSPFELKDNLIQLSKETARQGAAAMLNAGRGNPNWIATEPREAFFLLGEFALAECRRTWDEPRVHLAGMAHQDGIAGRFRAWLKASASRPGAS